MAAGERARQIAVRCFPRKGWGRRGTEKAFVRQHGESGRD